MPLNSATLWIVATPIGNPGDLSPRARTVLENAGLVLAEDTRRAARLFRECDIRAQRLESFFEHNEEQKIQHILETLKNGTDVALISDAGTPLVADPGYRLARACRQQGLTVSPVPGPSAPMAALSVAGIPPIPFSFLGFLPRSAGARKKLFADFAPVPGSLVFFERKDRLWESLGIAGGILGDRDVAICREITKTHEEFLFGKLGALEETLADLPGEITVILGPGGMSAKMPDSQVEAILENGLASGKRDKEVIAWARGKGVNWSGKELYALLAKLKKAARPKNGLLV